MGTPTLPLKSQPSVATRLPQCAFQSPPRHTSSSHRHLSPIGTPTSGRHRPPQAGDRCPPGSDDPLSDLTVSDSGNAWSQTASRRRAGQRHPPLSNPHHLQERIARSALSKPLHAVIQAHTATYHQLERRPPVGTARRRWAVAARRAATIRCPISRLATAETRGLKPRHVAGKAVATFGPAREINSTRSRPAPRGGAGRRPAFQAVPALLRQQLHALSPRCAGRCRPEVGVPSPFPRFFSIGDTRFRPATRGGAGLKTGVPSPLPDPVSPELLPQALAGDAQFVRCPTAAAGGAAKGAQQHEPLEGRSRGNKSADFQQREKGLRGSLHGIARERPRLRHHLRTNHRYVRLPQERAGKDRFQLADVPRPVAAGEHLEGLVGKPGQWEPMSLGQPRQERGGKLRQFAFPLPQRGESETDDPQSIEQVGAKTTRGRQVRQRPVGRCDQAEIGSSQPGLTHPPELPLLDCPQQQPLPPRRQFSDLIQKQGAAVRRLQEPRAGGIGTGERSPARVRRTPPPATRPELPRS